VSHESPPGSTVLERRGPRPDAVVRYARHPDGILDVHLPAGRPRGVVVLVHGGFWRAEYDRRHTRTAADALRAEGYAVVSPEYRRTGAAEDRRGGWPQTAEDVRAATAAAPAALAGLGVEAPPGLTVVGHSAGGHLALWLASEGLALDRVVALAPVGDLLDAHARGLGDGAVDAFLGGSPDARPGEYAAADPARRLQRPPGPSVVVLHGTEDDPVPVANSDWARRLPHVDLRVLPGVDHFAVLDPEAPAWADVLNAVAAPSPPPPPRG
jgi:acetyl esterase/lipase